MSTFRPTTLAEGIRLTPEEVRARTMRNRAIGLVLAGLVVLFYVITVSKLGLHLPGKGS